MQIYDNDEKAKQKDVIFGLQSTLKIVMLQPPSHSDNENDLRLTPVQEEDFLHFQA